MSARRWIAFALVVAAMLDAGSALAGTYLDSAALLLDESRRSAEFVQSHLGDVQLTTLAHGLAEARVKAGREVAVPEDVSKAHPHFLLALEAFERALAAAQDREIKKFFQLLVEARREEQAFRALLAQQHLNLPDLTKCTRR